MNKKMNILVACEESQAVTIELRKLGHNAFSCDIIECSGGHPEWHIMGNVLPLLNGNCCFDTVSGNIKNGYVDTRNYIDGKWDMIIAFPPCTYMTNASACRMYPTKGNINYERLFSGLEAADFFNKIFSADCDKIAIENPRPLKIIPIPKETQRIQPYEYAVDEKEFFTKLTYLWLKGLDKLTPIRTEKPIDTVPYVNAGCKDGNGNPRKKQGCKFSQKDRSKTFQGIAKAMASQWSGKVEE